MEDIAGLILDAIAARAKAGGARPPGAAAPGAAVARGAGMRPAAPVIVVPAPAPVTSMGRPIEAPGDTTLPPDVPLTLDPSVLGSLVPVASPPHRGLPQLLGSFAEPAPFLRAFVLSEALAPPIALRPPGR